jgi:hypothetical protein
VQQYLQGLYPPCIIVRIEFLRPFTIFFPQLIHEEAEDGTVKMSPAELQSDLQIQPGHNCCSERIRRHEQCGNVQAQRICSRNTGFWTFWLQIKANTVGHKCRSQIPVTCYSSYDFFRLPSNENADCVLIEEKFDLLTDNRLSKWDL